jgi:hypothetical protein
MLSCLLALVILTACTPQATNQATETVSFTPTSSPTAIPPTSTFTPVPQPQVTDYLLSMSDFPAASENPGGAIGVVKIRGGLTAECSYNDATYGIFQEIVEVSPHAYSELLPKYSDLGTPVKDPGIGDGSMLFDYSGRPLLQFYKGNIFVLLVSYYFDKSEAGDAEEKLYQDNFIALGKQLEARLPDFSTASLEIQVPQKTDLTQANDYFTNFEIGTSPLFKDFSSTATFIPSDRICWQFNAVTQGIPYDVIFVDAETNEAVQLYKEVTQSNPNKEDPSLETGCSWSNLSRGEYKVLISFADTIVASVNFEVK